MNTRKRTPGEPQTAFVPRSIFKTLFAGVVPAIAATSLAACASSAGGHDGSTATVAMVGFDANHNDASDVPTQPEVFGVADVGFDAGGMPDEGIIVLAMIGFSRDPDPGRDPQSA